MLREKIGRVLIVDDDADILTAMRLLLKPHVELVHTEPNPSNIPARLKDLSYDAILLDVDFDILLKRLTWRRTCSLTGKLLNIYMSPQEELDACTNAGGELIQREDDNEETIANRLDVYRENTQPLVEFYRKRGKLKSIDADGAVDEVHARLLAALA